MGKSMDISYIVGVVILLVNKGNNFFTCKRPNNVISSTPASSNLTLHFFFLLTERCPDPFNLQKKMLDFLFWPFSDHADYLWLFISTRNERSTFYMNSSFLVHGLLWWMYIIRVISNIFKSWIFYKFLYFNKFRHEQESIDDKYLSHSKI